MLWLQLLPSKCMIVVVLFGTNTVLYWTFLWNVVVLFGYPSTSSAFIVGRHHKKHHHHHYYQQQQQPTTNFLKQQPSRMTNHHKNRIIQQQQQQQQQLQLNHQLETEVDDDDDDCTGSVVDLSRRNAVLRTTTASILFSSVVAITVPIRVNAATTTTSTSVGTTGTSTSTSNTNYKELVDRFENNILIKPPVRSLSSTELLRLGIDNLYYPDYLEGSWDVIQTLVKVIVPLDKKYVGGPNGIETIAEQSIQEAQSRINQPVNLQLRYVPCTTTTTRNNGNVVMVVVEDRLFNTQSRLNNFAGRTVVANSNYVDTNGSNRVSILKYGGSEQDPLTTTLVRYKGPAVQKTFVTSHTSAISTTMNDNNSNSNNSNNSNNNKYPTWIGSETQRSLFALTNESTSPPITTDTEYLYQFTPVQLLNNENNKNDKNDNDNNINNNSNNHPITIVEGKLRIIGYLNPNDKYYFETKNRGVIIQDYTLSMKRQQS